MIELERCPCCGQIAQVISGTVCGDDRCEIRYRVECIGCMLQTHNGYVTPVEAANAWNMRVKE